MAWGSVISGNTLAQLITALNDPRFVLGAGNFTIDDLTVYVQNVVLAHNLMMKDLLSKYVRFTGSRDWITWSGTTPAEFQVRTEQVRPGLQRTTATPQISGAPLAAKEYAFGITEEGLRIMTGPEFQQLMTTITDGDKLRLIKDLLYRLLTPTQEDVYDNRLEGRLINVRGLANGDSWVYPRGVLGKVISGSHNHYMFQTTSTLTDLDLDRLIRNVREHGHKKVKIICSPNDEGVFNATNIPGFNAALYVGTQPGISTQHIDPSLRQRQQEDETSSDEVFIGMYKGVPIYTLWYWATGYIQCIPLDVVEEAKPVVCRTFTGSYTLSSAVGEIGNVAINGTSGMDSMSRPGFGDLRVMTGNGRAFETLFDISHFEREVGFGIGNRTGAAIMYLGTGSYVIPDVETLVISI